MTRFHFSLFLFLLSAQVWGQFPVGNFSHTFTDPNRNGRQIGCQIFYPATSSGTSTPSASGSFPVIVFGHGFLMTYAAYQNLWEDLVPEGYIIAFVTTEGGPFPSHQNFGLDLRFVSNFIGELGENASSVLYNHIAPERAIAGHSMGGGATWIAASGISSIQCIIGLAPAETTNPAATLAGGGIQVPALVLSGSSDAVTTPVAHHQPLYQSVASECKAFASLENGSHCYFAQPGSLCDIGETAPGAMTRPRQQQITRELMLHWLDCYLKGDVNAIASFESYDLENGDTSISTTCTFLNLQQLEDVPSDVAYPNPFRTTLSIQLPNDHSVLSACLYSADGRVIPIQCERTGRSITLNTSALPSGIYILRLHEAGRSWRVIRE